MHCVSAVISCVTGYITAVQCIVAFMCDSIICVSCSPVEKCLRLIHTCRAMRMPCACHATPLPFSNSAVSFVKVRVVAGNIQTASPTI
jgi:hypothetical protein